MINLSRWMQWLMISHLRRYHRHYGSSGHVWQGRFKAFPIQQDYHFLTVLRYVEQNPRQAGLIDKAQNWPWSSLYALLHRNTVRLLTGGPIPRPRHWLSLVNEIEPEKDLGRLRTCVNRGSPFGSAPWNEQMAAAPGLESTVHARGRPRKTPSAGNE